MMKSCTRYYSEASSNNFIGEALRLYEILAPPRAGIPLAHRWRRALRGITLNLPAASLGKLYESLAPPCAGIPLAHRCRRALR
eukprot:3071816-Pyramimonas_sp.AAC.1